MSQEIDPNCIVLYPNTDLQCRKQGKQNSWLQSVANIYIWKTKSGNKKIFQPEQSLRSRFENLYLNKDL